MLVLICTFFGHRIVPNSIETELRNIVIKLIEHNNVDLFYVGNNGGFDGMVHKVLNDLSKKYNIAYYVVLAYMPGKNDKFCHEEYINTIFPDGIETIPKRFAINYRNKWMIDRSDYVVTYVNNYIGSGAAQFKQKAEKKGKMVINISYDIK